MAYGLSGGGAQRCSFADASVSSIVSIFVTAVDRFFSCVRVSVDESLCITSDATSPSGWCISAKVIVRWFFAFGVSPLAASWTPQRVFNFSADSSVVSGAGCWWLCPTVASSVLKYRHGARSVFDIHSARTNEGILAVKLGSPFTCDGLGAEMRRKGWTLRRRVIRRKTKSGKGRIADCSHSK